MAAGNSLKERVSDSVLHSVLEATADGVLIFGLDGEIHHYNSRFAEIWDLPEDLLAKGEDDRLLDHAKDRMADPEEFVRGVEYLYEHPEEEIYDLLQFKDGRVVERYAKPWREGDEVVGRVVTFRDVTDQHQTQERLRASRERYRTLLDQNVAGVYRTRLDGKILQCNDALAHLFGYEAADELIGRSAAELYSSSEDRENFVRELEARGSLLNHENTLKQRDGTDVHVLENCMLTEDPLTEEPVIVGTLIDISERRRLQEELEEMAYHDPLTGLPNRRLLESQADRALRQADRRGERVALLFTDLRRFKRINDTFGHETGDQVLAQVGRRLAGRTRGADLCARVGGDEFALLLTDVDETADAREAAHRVESCFEQPFQADEQAVHLQARIGVALYPDHASNFSQLLSCADQAMFDTDPNTGGLVALYQPLLEEAPSDEVSREEAFREALAEDELCLHYQPIYRVGTDRMVGAEGLVRWQRPGAGLLRAAQFVPLAERTGLVRELDRRILADAAEHLAGWSQSGEGPDWVSVNLSAGTLGDPELTDFLGELLEDKGVEEGRLVVEVTERVAMRDPESVAQSLQKLEKLGVPLAIDDYGTGHAVLAYLKHFDAKYLKLDMIFVHRLGEDPRDEDLLEGVVTLGHQLDMELIAEGVESSQQYEALERMGADLAQGYHLGEPVAPEVLASSPPGRDRQPGDA